MPPWLRNLGAGMFQGMPQYPQPQGGGAMVPSSLMGMSGPPRFTASIEPPSFNMPPPNYGQLGAGARPMGAPMGSAMARMGSMGMSGPSGVGSMGGGMGGSSAAWGEMGQAGSRLGSEASADIMGGLGRLGRAAGTAGRIGGGALGLAGLGLGAYGQFSQLQGIMDSIPDGAGPGGVVDAFAQAYGGLDSPTPPNPEPTFEDPEGNYPMSLDPSMMGDMSGGMSMGGPLADMAGLGGGGDELESVHNPTEEATEDGSYRHTLQGGETLTGLAKAMGAMSPQQQMAIARQIAQMSGLDLGADLSGAAKLKEGTQLTLPQALRSAPQRYAPGFYGPQGSPPPPPSGGSGGFSQGPSMSSGMRMRDDDPMNRFRR